MSAGNNRSRMWLALLCVGVVSASGCFTRRPPKATWGRSWALQPPVVQPGMGTALDAPPEFAVDNITEPAADLAVMRAAPTRPRVAPPPAAEPAKPGKEPEPGITPEFSARELEAAKVETQRSLAAMEKNLTQASGRTLNPTQQDLISKVRGFADNAREAMKTGDWVRAKNLSKKAEVLSQELAAGL